MNWNGKHKNDILGSMASCRESIAQVKQRGSSPGAEWLLEKVDPKSTALICLVAPLTQWIDALPETERETWLLWAMGNRSEYIRDWLGYDSDWTMIPAVCKGSEKLVCLAHVGRLPSTYLVPGEPRSKDALGPITLDNGLEMEGIKLATVTYVVWNEQWYKVHYPKLPSKSAISRAIRLYLLGILVGRTITTANDLAVYEVTGIKSWTSYDTLVNGIAQHAGDALFHLLVEPEVLNG